MSWGVSLGIKSERTITMTFEDAVDEIDDAEALMLIAYKKLMNVEKRCPKAVGYPLKDVIITLDSARLALILVQDDYSAMR